MKYAQKVSPQEPGFRAVRYFNAHTAAQRPVDQQTEKFVNPSLTVPDQSMRIEDMIARHLAGHNMARYQPEYVPENSPIPVNFERMDKIQRAQMLKEVSLFVKDTRGKLITAKQAAERAKFEQDVIARHEAEKAAKAEAVKFEEVKE